MGHVQLTVHDVSVAFHTQYSSLVALVERFWWCHPTRQRGTGSFARGGHFWRSENIVVGSLLPDGRRCSLPQSWVLRAFFSRPMVGEAAQRLPWRMSKMGLNPPGGPPLTGFVEAEFARSDRVVG